MMISSRTSCSGQLIAVSTLFSIIISTAAFQRHANFSLPGKTPVNNFIFCHLAHVIVWQRFCEPARLRIAQFLSVCLCSACPTCRHVTLPGMKCNVGQSDLEALLPEINISRVLYTTVTSESYALPGHC